MEEAISKQVIHCAFEVSSKLGTGFLEKVYERALCYELRALGIHYEAQKTVSVMYKGIEIGNYLADLIVEERLLVELKAVSTFDKIHEAQVLNYLRATGLPVGLLLNFGRPKLGIKRIVWQHDETENI